MLCNRTLNLQAICVCIRYSCFPHEISTYTTRRQEFRQMYYIIRDSTSSNETLHDDVIQWKKFLRYWPFVRGIHRSPVDSPHKDQWSALEQTVQQTPRHRWKGAPSRSLWHHCNVITLDPDLLRHMSLYLSLFPLGPKCRWNFNINVSKFRF